MTCFSPLTMYRDPANGGALTSRPSGSGIPIQVGCNRCIGCRLAWSSMWATRAMAETRMHADNSFLTLTQSDIYCRPWSSLHREDIQKFFKRLARAGYSARNMHCGEYGSSTFRAHYHVIGFGLAFPDQVYFKDNERGERLYTSAILERIWGRGQCLIGDVTHESAAYVAGYTLRDTGAKHPGGADVVRPDTGEIVSRALPFFGMSRNPGIGAPFVKKYGSQLLNCDQDFMVTADGAKVATPRYFLDKLAEGNPEAVAALRENRTNLACTDHAKRERRPERLRSRELFKRSQLAIARRGSRRGSQP